MRYPALFLMLSFSISASFSQRVIKGKILNHTTKVPIAYVNIGIPGSPVGSLSNEDGTFSISIPGKNNSDTLIFSALGFVQRSMPLPALLRSNDVVVTLKEKTVILETVVVTAKKEKKETFSLGNRYTKGGFLYADSVSAGAAMALLIDNKYPSFYSKLSYPLHLEEVSFYIDKNSLSDFKIRVRILAYDSSSGLPAEDLLNESVVITSSEKKGWLKVDLRPYHLLVQQRFFLVLEWILEDNDRLSLVNQYFMYRKNNPDKVRRDSTIVNGKKIGFWTYNNFSPGTRLGVSPIPFSLQNYICYYKTNSLGEWKRSPVILTARVLVSNQTVATNRQQSGVSKEGDQELTLGKFCNNFLSESPVNGFQLAVMKDGKLVFTKGYGYADRQKGIEVTPKTRFRIGSISKCLTSAALIKLIKETKLNLDKPIDAYLPRFSHFKYPVTTRQLAGHLAGIRHYRDGDIEDLVRYDDYSSTIEALRIIENDTLLFKPGENFQYSSFGWNIIGAVIEKTSGRHYLEYARENVWKPFGLSSVSGAVKDSVFRNCSKGYLVTGEAFDEENLSYKYPSGGLISNCEDLAAFGSMLLSQMEDPVTAQLFTTMHLNNGIKTNYGIGWNIGKDRNGHRIFFHSGNMINGSGFLVLYPDDNIVVAFLCNSPEGISFDVQKIPEFFISSSRHSE